ncbi:MAG TPA: HNH endonuclease signature motif containing protein, partial [Streptosporangiaceae bacterium]|nr:HNH endonuclease signature motif containing protein [Streptosporangiaceae bacterium]
TRSLSDDDAARVEALIFPAAAAQTTGQLRVTLAKTVIAVDPEAAARRREEALKDPRVRRWREDAGTAALAGFGLPSADVLAADQRLTERARALRNAGLPGTLEELRARAYLDTLLDRESIPAPPPDSGPAVRRPDPSPPIASRVNLTVPLDTGTGHSNAPGLAAGFGPVDGPLARDLLAAAAAHPASRFCLTVTAQDGQAIGHSCLPGPGAWPTLTTQGLKVPITPLARGECDHRHQEPGYQPSRELQHLIQARNRTCSAPGCQRPAARCDLDHTIPYDQGGRTCECDLAPLCRHHHRCKQSEGWRLQQPQPGVLIWTTPAGRQYRTTPDAYP